MYDILFIIELRRDFTMIYESPLTHIGSDLCCIYRRIRIFLIKLLEFTETLLNFNYVIYAYVYRYDCTDIYCVGRGITDTTIIITIFTIQALLV